MSSYVRAGPKRDRSWFGGLVLAATDLDPASTVATRRAWELSRSLGARFSLAHALPRASSFPTAHTLVTTRSVIGWAAEHCNLALEPKHVRVRVGRPEQVLAAVAEEEQACLVVIGRSPSPELFLDLARSVPVLAATPSRRSHEMLVATDLCDPELPVVRRAESFAAACGHHLTVFHRPEPAISLSTTLAAAPRLRVGRLRSAPAAIAAMAEERNADVVAVGLRRGHGSTLRALMDIGLDRSVLAIPISAT